MILLGFAGYTALLLGLGRRGKATDIHAYRDGNGTLSFWTIFVMVTALWSSSLIAVEIDTAYQSGLGALWYGVSVACMSLLVSLLIPWFRRQHYISNSELLGRHFGRSVRRLTGLVIGVTFPIFALSNALAAAVFLQIAFGWSLWLSLTVITALLILYVQFSGMLSLAHTQGFNLLMVLGGLGYAAWKLSHAAALSHATVLSSGYGHLLGVGHGLIWVWFGMNTLNVLSAQAEIQVVGAARTARQAQWGIWLSTAILLAVTALSVWLGMQARLLAGGAGSNGLAAFFHLVLAGSAPIWIAFMGMAMWSLALMWCGPLLFSGAISVGGDLFGHPGSINWLRVSFLAEGALMVLLALWRPDQLAWWRVFGLTLRNAAVVGPTLAVLLWPDLKPRAVGLSMICGVGAGLGLNALTGFSATQFVLGINPMWSAAAITLIILTTARLLQQGLRRKAAMGTGAWAALSAGIIFHPPHSGILGVLIVLLGLLYMAYAWAACRPQTPYLQSIPAPGENAKTD